MPAIASNPVHSVHSAAVIGSKPAAPKTPEAQKESLVSSLSRTDVYINSNAQLAENVILSLFNSYNDSKSAMNKVNGDGAMVVTDFVNVGASVKSAAIQRTVTSSLNNGFALIRGKVTLAEAGGRVAGDVATSTVSSGMGAIATNVAVWGIAKAGGGSLYTIAGGMVAGFVVNNASRMIMNKTGVTSAITDKTTEALQSLSGVSKN